MADVSSVIENASTISLPHTGYADFPGDKDAYLLGSQTAPKFISVLPDVMILRFSDSSGLLFSEVALAATVWRLVITTTVNGSTPTWELFKQLDYKQDDILNSTYPQYVVAGAEGGFFISSLVEFQPRSVVTNTALDGSKVTFEYTDQYALEVTAEPTTPSLNIPSAGRYLITEGSPTGQRSAIWGGWVNEVTVVSVEPPPLILPDSDLSVLPAFAEYTASDSSTTDFVVRSPAWHLDEASSTWSINGTALPAPYNTLPDAFVRGASEELTEKFEDFILTGYSFGNSALKAGLAKIYNSFQSASEVRNHVGSFFKVQFGLLEEGFQDILGGKKVDLSDWGRRVDTSWNRFSSDSQDIITRNANSSAASWWQNTFDGARIGTSHSDVSAVFDIDIDVNKRPIVMAAGHKDVFIGSAGRDSIWLGDLDDLAHGREGDDLINGEGGNDFLFGGAGHDLLRGGDGNDWLEGSTGDDFLAGGPGNDSLNGGSGLDRVAFSVGATRGISVNLNLQGTSQDTGEGIDTLIGIEHVSGTRFSDIITGDGQDNWLWGGSDGSGITGDDVIQAGAGSDLVQVGTGNHRLDGGTGTDTLSFQGNGSDITSVGVIFSLAAQGAVQNSKQGLTLATNFENISGSAFGDTLTGDGGSNILAGYTGDDLLLGGNGDDLLFGDGVVLAETSNGRSGPIKLYADATTKVAGLTAGNDRLFGGAGNDILVGGAGNDTLDGGSGIDTAQFSNLFRSYSVNLKGANGAVSSAADGADTLTSIEIIEFKDGRLVFDAEGAAATVTRMYDTVLRRAPDQAGLDLWVDQIEDRGGTLKDVANGFLNSAEFQAKTGRLSNAEYVEFLYVNALGRASDPGGKANWIERLNNGSYDRADLLIGFSESLEHRNATADLVAKGFFDTHDAYQTVALLYDSFAGRLPDAGGLVHWAEALKSGAMTLSQVAAGFANSAEFQGLIKGMSHSDLVEFMYQNTLDRASDAAGKASWVKMLDAGLSDTDLLIGFSQSGEHFHLIGPHITNGIDYF